LTSARRAPEPSAVVLGDVDLVRAAGLAGARVTLVASPADPARHSRHVADFVDATAPGLAERLLTHAAASGDRPALLYQSDRSLRLLLDHRERLERAFRLVLPDTDIVEAVLDKVRFQALAQDLGLPVPVARRVDPAQAGALGVPFPAVIKPAGRDLSWFEVMGYQKVSRVEDERDWQELAPRLAGAGIEVLAQELVPGGEDRIESHHLYVDAAGEVAGEFTGRKIRTRPAEYGLSTALVTTDAADVRRVGRDVVERLGLRGVVKLDFKRASDGRLRLLEVNPRFTLWAHLGAVAGVNLVALVLADLHDRPRPPAGPARSGVRWVEPRQDLGAIREQGGSLGAWSRWAATCEAKSGFALGDPMPLVRGKLWPRIAGRAGRRA